MSTTPNPATPITQDLPCAHCTYNLRTRLPTDLCPECAHPVADSIAEYSTQSRLFPNPTLVSTAMTLIATGFAIVTLFQFVRVPPAPANFLLAFLTIVLINLGFAILIHAQRKSRASTPALYRIGNIVNGANAVISLFQLTRNMISLSAPRSAFRILFAYFPPWTQIVSLESQSLTLALLYALLALYFARLARCMKSPFYQFYAIVAFYFLSLMECAYFIIIGIRYCVSVRTGSAPFITSELISFISTQIAPIALFATTLFILLLARRIATFPNAPSTPSQNSNHNPQ